jgi:hypothetical protein
VVTVDTPSAARLTGFRLTFHYYVGLCISASLSGWFLAVYAAWLVWPQLTPNRAIEHNLFGQLVAAFVFPLVGTAALLHRPPVRHRTIVGWLCVIAGVAISASALISELTSARDAAQIGVIGLVAGWMGIDVIAIAGRLDPWFWVIPFSLISTIIPTLFPDGVPPKASGTGISRYFLICTVAGVIALVINIVVRVGLLSIPHSAGMATAMWIGAMILATSTIVLRWRIEPPDTHMKRAAGWLLFANATIFIGTTISLVPPLGVGLFGTYFYVIKTMTFVAGLALSGIIMIMTIVIMKVYELPARVSVILADYSLSFTPVFIYSFLNFSISKIIPFDANNEKGIVLILIALFFTGLLKTASDKWAARYSSVAQADTMDVEKLQRVVAELDREVVLLRQRLEAMEVSEEMIDPSILCETGENEQAFRRESYTQCG